MLFAVLISALRLMLPYAQNHHKVIEDYINSRYQSNISIGYFSMGWHKSGPILIANDVQLVSNDVAKLFIDNIDIRLNFWHSIRSQKLITDNFVISGARLTLDRQVLLQTTSTIDANTDANTDGKQALTPILESLADLFYEQIDRFSIIESKVVVNNEDRQRTFLISTLDWLNLDGRHFAKADVIVDGLTSNNIKLSLDVEGNNSKDINGTLYLEGNNLNITPWLDRVLAIENEKTHSSINFSAWLTIEQGLAKQLQLAFDDSEISWQHQNNHQNFTLNNGQILLSNLDKLKQLTIESTALQFSVNNQAWEPLIIEVTRNNKDIFTYLSYLDLASLTSLFPLFSADEKMRKIVQSLAMQGSVDDFYFQSKAEKIQVSAEFDDFSTGFTEGIPGIKNSKGSILFADKTLQLDLTANKGALDFKHHFILPIPYDELSLNLTVDFNDEGWQLNTQQLDFSSDELTLSAEVGVEVPNEGLAKMSLLASVTAGHAELAHHYFPLTSMSENLVAYLKKGLVKGDIEQALVIYQGAFADFPFEDHSGIFTVDAELSNSQFNFDDNWTDLSEFSANLNFTNNSMNITGRSGYLSGIDVTGVEVGIAELAGDSILTIDMDLNHIAPKNVTQLMLNSSLKDSVGKTLEQLKISNEVSGNFTLNLPLDRPEGLVAKGLINFHDNVLNLQRPEMTFRQLKGQLTFNNDVINTQDLSLTWQGLPITLNVQGIDKDDYFSTNIHINAHWQQQDWTAHVPEQFKEYADGPFQWQGDLYINTHHDGGFSYNFNGSSSLEGLSLSTPAPFDKTAKDNSTFSLNVVGGPNISTLDIRFDEQLRFDGVLNHVSTVVGQENELVTAPLEKLQTGIFFSQAHLILGNENLSNEKILLPIDGFYITTALTEADFSSWQPFVSDIIDSISYSISDKKLTVDENENKNKHARPLLAQPERIIGSIGTLNILGQSLTDVSFSLLDKEQWWLLQLNAKEAETEIKFYPSWLEKGVDVAADFLHLGVESNAHEKTTILAAGISQLKDDKALFSHIPPMRFTCGSCRVGDVDFGQLTFELQRNQADKINITHFSANRNGSQLSLTGFWQFDESLAEKTDSQTSLVGKLSVSDIEFEMDKLGFGSSIKESGALLDFSLGWQGGPQDFLLSRLNGNVNAKLDDGVLSDVDDKGLRVASILSLGSLARKLKLDFRDIFSEGMFYSEITGDFEIKEGVFYTKNTEMKGAAGDLAIKGNTDLTAGLLDYRMNYKPNLTSSFPTIAWIATLDPVVFLTGLAINEIITATVIYEVVFEITGDVNKPVVREVNRKNQDVSVGSSSPPNIIEESSAPKKQNKSGDVNLYKEISTSDQFLVLPNVKGDVDG